MRISSNNIASLKSNEIFVFGSNLGGYHGAGAAKTAMQWGANYGQGKGLQGQTYAIPTKDRWIKTLPLQKIEEGVIEFAIFAEANPQLNFLVTEIGCGLAGYSPKDIALLFKGAVNLKNVYLPKSFWDVLSP